MWNNNADPDEIGEYIGNVTRQHTMAVEKGMVKPLDPNTAPRYMRYIPYWAWFKLLDNHP